MAINNNKISLLCGMAINNNKISLLCGMAINNNKILPMGFFKKNEHCLLHISD
jgi:hypothetical protein